MSALISDEYKAQQTKLHEDPDYGIMSVHFAPMISLVINHMGVDNLLDYGCGKARLRKCLKVDHPLSYFGYDPGVEEFSSAPQPAEMVACVDMLEHIEPDCLEAVLDDLQRLTVKLIFLTVHTGPAGRVLPDGRNAHLIQKPKEWWMQKLSKRFDLEADKEDTQGFWAVMVPKAII